MLFCITLPCSAKSLLAGDDKQTAAKQPAANQAAAHETAATQTAVKSVEQIAAAAKDSIAVIVFTGRDGKQQGLGTGFVIAPDGLIATNLHVIGEARPITVQFSDGTKHAVTSIHASDRATDLAIVKIDAQDLKPLELADSNKLKNGQAVVVLGHPRGLEHSVVSGVVSGKRDIDGVGMIQLAIPIEQGNSGGPVLDLEGKVRGIVTMKSAVTANLGFAAPANALKPLLERPNPIPIQRWLTIGALDKSEWKTLLGGRWRQRSGRIIADGSGTGFGGRTMCLWQHPLPKIPYEVAVTVKLDDEKGAAGLLFHADGGDKHYGFYPSAGKLRLTRFNGPDVFSWKILDDIPSQHYRPGEWNTLKVRVEKDKFRCYLNEHLLVESTDDAFTQGTVGLAKFRDTVAEFKHFQVAERIGSKNPPGDVVARLTKMIENMPLKMPLKEPPAKIVEALIPDGPTSIAILRHRARQLEEQAAQLRKLATVVHHERCLAELIKATDGEDKSIDLLQAALVISRLDNEELEVEAYRKEVDRLARQAAETMPPKADATAKIAALNKFLFEERGYHGSRVDYYTRATSYLNDVIDDREGLPITLSVLYMETARRLGVNVVGVALPGHFMVRHEPVGGPKQLIDVFNAGKLLSDDEASEVVRKIVGRLPDAKEFQAVSKKAILKRMIHNLIGVAQNEQDGEGMLRYLDAILAVDAQSHEERWVRAVFRWRQGQPAEALDDCEWLLRTHPPGVDLERVRELRKLLHDRMK